MFGKLVTYLVNATVGTPPQALSLMLVVSSPLTWVPDVSFCADWSGCPYGSFNISSSSTAVLDSKDAFSVHYVDGSEALGDVIRDAVGLGPGLEVIRNVTMGHAHAASQRLGILSVGFGEKGGPPGFVDRMAEQGIANSSAVSMWVDDVAGTTGSVLFGAVDTARFRPPLKRVPATRASIGRGAGDGFAVQVASIKVVRLASASSESHPPAVDQLLFEAESSDLPVAVLGPSDSVSVLPARVARAIWAIAGATYDDDFGYAIVPCQNASASAVRLEVEIGRLGWSGGPKNASSLGSGSGSSPGAVISASLQDLALPPDAWSEAINSTTRCIFGIQSDLGSSTPGSGFYGLGGPLTKGSYLTFDMVNEEAAIAPVRFANDLDPAGRVVPFPSYGAATPESTAVTAVGCTTPKECDVAQGPGASSGESGLTQGAKIGFGVGFGVGGALLVALALWTVKRWVRNRREEGKTCEVGDEPVNDEPADGERVDGPVDDEPVAER